MPFRGLNRIISFGIFVVYGISNNALYKITVTPKIKFEYPNFFYFMYFNLTKPFLKLFF